MNQSKQYQFESACQKNDLNTVKALYQDKEVNPAGNDNYSIKQACQMGHINIVKFLIDNCSVNFNSSDLFCLKKSINNNRLDVVEFLLKQKDIEVDIFFLWCAIEEGKNEMVKVLLDSNKFDPLEAGNNAFYSAFRLKNVEIISILWEYHYIRTDIFNACKDTYNQTISILKQDKINKF